MNLYGYVRNQPLIFRDSLGLYPGNDITTTLQNPEIADVLNHFATDPHSRAAVATTASAGYGVAKIGATSLLAYGGTSVAAAGAGTVGAVAVGGLTIGGVIGLPIGIYTSNLPSNPFVNGSLNPWGQIGGRSGKRTLGCAEAYAKP